MSDEKTMDPAASTPTAAPTPKIPKTRQQLQVEYTHLAGQLGNLVLQIALMKQQRDGLMQQMDATAAEAASLPPEAKPAPKLVPQPPKAGSDGT